MTNGTYSERNVKWGNQQRNDIVLLPVLLVFLITGCSGDYDPINVTKASYVDRYKSITVSDVLERRPGCSTNTWEAMKDESGHQFVTLTCEVLISSEALERARQHLVEQETRLIRNQVSGHQARVSTARENLARLTSPTTEGTAHPIARISRSANEPDENHFMTSFLYRTSDGGRLTDDQLIDAVRPADGVPDFVQLLWTAGWNPRGLFAQIRYMNEHEGQAREDYKSRNVKPQVAILRSKLNEIRANFEQKIKDYELAAQRRADAAERRSEVDERRAALKARDRALRIERAEGELAERKRKLETATNSLDIAMQEALDKALEKLPREQIVERWEWSLSPDKMVIPLRYYLAVIDEQGSERIISEIRPIAPIDAAGADTYRYYSRVNFTARAGDTGQSILKHYSSFIFLIRLL